MKGLEARLGLELTEFAVRCFETHGMEEEGQMDVVMRKAAKEELEDLDQIRAAAFAPVFASFRSLLGDEVYELAQAHEDEAQGEELVKSFEEDSVWEVFSAELEGEVVGFVSVRVDEDKKLGEIGLNAVHPEAAGKGVGSVMYEFALQRMRDKGALVATVATGADDSHAPARRAYEKVGFDVSVPSVWYCRML